MVLLTGTRKCATSALSRIALTAFFSSRFSFPKGSVGGSSPSSSNDRGAGVGYRRRAAIDRWTNRFIESAESPRSDGGNVTGAGESIVAPRLRLGLVMSVGCQVRCFIRGAMKELAACPSWFMLMFMLCAYLVCRERVSGKLRATSNTGKKKTTEI